MPNIKISQLDPLAVITTDDFFPLVDSGSMTTKRTGLTQLDAWATGNLHALSASYASSSRSASYANVAAHATYADVAGPSDICFTQTGGFVHAQSGNVDGALTIGKLTTNAGTILLYGTGNDFANIYFTSSQLVLKTDNNGNQPVVYATHQTGYPVFERIKLGVKTGGEDDSSGALLTVHGDVSASLYLSTKTNAIGFQGTASYAVTSSYAEHQNPTASFLQYNGNYNGSASYSITASNAQTASIAITASNAITASHALSVKDGLNDATPIGTIMAFASTTVPNNWIECNGSSQLISNYTALYNAIKITPHGTETFGYTCDVSGTYVSGGLYFKLPDLRGEFVRGYDNGKGIDDSRVFASSQLDQVGNHTHKVPAYFSSMPASTQASAGIRGDSQNTIGAYQANIIAMDVAETRPRNVALMYCIKYSNAANFIDPTGLTMAGDVIGNYTTTTVQNIQNKFVDMTGLDTGSVLRYNGTSFSVPIEPRSFYFRNMYSATRDSSSFYFIKETGIKKVGYNSSTITNVTTYPILTGWNATGYARINSRIFKNSNNKSSLVFTYHWHVGSPAANNVVFNLTTIYNNPSVNNSYAATYSYNEYHNPVQIYGWNSDGVLDTSAEIYSICQQTYLGAYFPVTGIPMSKFYNSSGWKFTVAFKTLDITTANGYDSSKIASPIKLLDYNCISKKFYLIDDNFILHTFSTSVGYDIKNDYATGNKLTYVSSRSLVVPFGIDLVAKSVQYDTDGKEMYVILQQETGTDDVSSPYIFSPFPA